MSDFGPVVAVPEPIAETALARLAVHTRLLGPEACRDGTWKAEAEAVILRNIRFSRADIEAAPKLRVIAKHGVGLDTIDLEAAREFGIPVLNTPKANAVSVAELTLAFMLALARSLSRHDQALRAGRPLRGGDRIGVELMASSVGIVGFGAIGQEVGRRLHHGFAARVLAYDPYLPDDAWPDWVERVGGLGQLIPAVRFLSLHVPYTQETHYLIGAAELARLPRGGFVVNCARGGVVDEHALAAALRSGHIAGAASDVFLVEPPPPDHPLLSCDHFMASPHIGASTEQSLERVGTEIVDRLLAEFGIKDKPYAIG